MVRLVISTREFEGEISELLGRAQNASGPLRAWGQHMVGSVKTNFQEGGRPTHWAPLKVKTLLARYMRSAGAKKLTGSAPAGTGRFAPAPAVFKKGDVGVGAVSTVAGFARNKRGAVARNRSGGLNKFARAGYVFRTQALRAITMGKALLDTGRLRSSISAALDGRQRVLVGTNVVYAASHNFGDPSRGIPERPFLVIQAEDETEFADLVSRWVLGGESF